MSDLRFIRIVRKIENTRSNEDRRKKVDKYVCEYRDKDNVEFRKSFEFKVNEIPNIPEIIYDKEPKQKQQIYKTYTHFEIICKICKSKSIKISFNKQTNIFILNCIDCKTTDSFPANK